MPGPRKAGARPPARKWLAPAGLIALAAVTYLRALDCGWIWDDADNITECAPVLAWNGLRAIWLDPGAIQQYYPILHTTFWIEHKLWGLNPLGFHAVNVLLHALNAVLMWRVLRRLGIAGAPAWIAGALFAVHPVHVESVAWVTERKNTLSFSFYLGSALVWLRWAGLAQDRKHGEGNPRVWLASFGLFVLALLSKSATATLPLALVAVAWWKRGAVGRRETSLLPFLAASAAAALMTIYLEAQNVGTARLQLGLDAAERVLLVGRAFLFYGWKLLFPVPLNFVYPRWTLDPAAAWQWLFPIAVVAAGMALLLLHRRIGRGPAAAFLAWAVTLAPMLGFFDLYWFRYTLVSDHFQYHASVAPLALAGVGLAGAGAALDRRTPGAGRALIAAILLALGVLSATRVPVFRDNHSLWTDTLSRNPDAWIAWNNLGRETLDAGRLSEAEPMFRRAIASDARAHEPWNNLGICLMAAGRPADALAAFRRSLVLRPGYKAAAENLGRALLVTGDLPEAVEVLRQAVSLRGHSPDASLDLMEALIRSRRFDEAEQVGRAARSEFPGDPRLDLLFGKILRMRGATAEALEVLTLAVNRTHRRDPVALDALASALAAAGRFDLAVRIIEEALALESSPEADAVLRSHLDSIRRGVAPP